ncbi:MAG: YfcE family phosphodiesterase [Candidatus Omnitrophota bacterium]|nr:MAG: YfcE family phosphodiesterase [Candidatus Omnitrophota bacterium]
MEIGVLSDTHDNLKKLDKAVRLFNKNKVAYVLHAGDFIAPFTLDKLDKLNCNWQGVFGNNDGETQGLRQRSKNRIRKGPLRMKLGNRKITLVHDPKTISLKRDNSDLAVFGHTHKPLVKKQNNKLLVNPGECGGWLSGESTIALVDLDSLSARIFTI